MENTRCETKCRRCSKMQEHRFEEDPLEVLHVHATGTSGYLFCSQCSKVTVQDLVSIDFRFEKSESKSETPDAARMR